MTTVPGPLIWEIVKRNNSFLVEKFGNGNVSVRFSKESNNLYNLNSYNVIYKHSGLANKETVTIQPGKENAVVISTTKTKKQNKLALLRNKSVLKKDFSRMVKAVSNQNFFDDHSTRATEARDLACLPVSPKKKFACRQALVTFKSWIRPWWQSKFLSIFLSLFISLLMKFISLMV